MWNYWRRKRQWRHGCYRYALEIHNMVFFVASLPWGMPLPEALSLAACCGLHDAVMISTEQSLDGHSPDISVLLQPVALHYLLHLKCSASLPRLYSNVLSWPYILSLHSLTHLHCDFDPFVPLKHSFVSVMRALTLGSILDQIPY